MAGRSPKNAKSISFRVRQLAFAGALAGAHAGSGTEVELTIPPAKAYSKVPARFSQRMALRS